MKSNERLIYTNFNGESIEFSFYSNYVPTYFENSLVNQITSSKNSYLDGETFESDCLDSRYLALEGFFELRLDNFLERNMKRVLNPKLTGELIYDDGEKELRISVRLEHIPTIKRSLRKAVFAIDFKAHNPFWTEVEKMEYIALLRAMLSWPIVSHVKKGVIFGIRKSVMETEIINIGDVESGFRVLLKAKGEVENPFIRDLYSDKSITLKVNMVKGDVIEVINRPSQKIVLKNGVKSFSILNRSETDFFNLKPGKNKLSYGAKLNAINLDVILYYSPLYL